MDMVKVGSFLQELRRQSNVTQEQLAERMGVARRTVSRWETGRNMPDLDILVELADFYEVDLREILNGERKGEHMNEELRETALQVAEYSGEEKLKITRRMHWLFLAGLASATVYLVLVLTNKADDFGGGLCLGIVRTAGYKDHDSTFCRPRSKPHRPVMHGAPTTRAPCQSLAQDHSQPSSAMRLRMDSLPSMCIILELYTTRSNAKSYVMRSPGRRARPGRSNAPANFA